MVGQPGPVTDIDARAADHRLVGLAPTGDPPRFSLTVTPAITTPFGFLYGGAGIAAAVAALESATDRPLVWITVQFVANALPDEVVDVTVEVVAPGRGTTQAQVRATVGDRLVFHALAALGGRPNPLAGQWAAMPDVPAPEDCPPFEVPFEAEGSFFERTDKRVATGPVGLDAVGRPAGGRVALWTRLPEGAALSAASLSFVADIVPMALGAALGIPPGATSLDNTVRMGRLVPADWVLLDVIADAVGDGYGHGRAHLWAQDGTLLAIASQSAILRDRTQER